MGAIRSPRSAMLILGAFSRYPEAIEWAHQCALSRFGAAIQSPLFEFHETSYYETTMGGDLRKTFFAFENLIDPAELVEIKHQTNAWEDAYREQFPHPETRPLNLDPGYLTEAKFVLASTKDHHHRLYLDRGIYAEVTLFFQHRQWKTREWTYPDYRRDDYHQFFLQCRGRLRQRLRESGDGPRQ